jgi:hypothetical protein
MTKRSVVVEVVSGTPRTHLWCDTCNTSARFEIDAYVLSKDGPMRIAVIKQCITCDYDEDQP